MKIKNYEENEDDIIFLVDSEKCKNIVQQLRSKKIFARCDDNDTSFRQVIASASIEDLNQALEDFPD